ncbi:MAG TPA: hypothetical protein VJO32_09080 [Ktedonobacteraceae bacterium]|nr:hypothetical protein [Ktedonobacteraceae bacterium]
MQIPVIEQRSHQSLSEILQELQVEDTESHREALETLAFYFIQQLGLEFKAWRKRGDKPEWAEVKAIAEGVHFIFSRWQIYCKNALDYKISEDDIAIEVGLSLPLKSNVIFIVTTGLFGRKALSYANSVTRETNLTIITIDREDLQALATSPQTLVDILNKKAGRTMELKVNQSKTHM